MSAQQSRKATRAKESRLRGREEMILSGQWHDIAFEVVLAWVESLNEEDCEDWMQC